MRRRSTSAAKRLGIRTLSSAVITLVATAHAAPTGAVTLQGRVVTATDAHGIPGATILVDSIPVGVTDSLGYFGSIDLQTGCFRASARSIGYTTQTLPERCLDGRDDTVTVLIRLAPDMIETEAITVSGEFFRKAPEAPVSVFQLNTAEVRHLPGSAGDISRILNVLPSTGRVSDRLNDLVVRGGSPFENGFYIDGIQVPNINHFPVQGSSAGPIGLVNADLVSDVRFYAGAFPANYGDRLSSITDIRLREGRTDRLGMTWDFSIAGVGGTLEGPLPDGHGSWLVSGRRSYFEIIADMLNLEAAPSFHDIHAKVTYELGANDQISLLDIYAGNTLEWTQQTSRDQGWGQFGRIKATQNTSGLSWRRVWSPQWHSATSVSYAFIDFDELWKFTYNERDARTNQSYEGSLRLRNVTHYSTNGHERLSFGFDLQQRRDDLEYQFYETLSLSGIPVPDFRLRKEFRSVQSAVFVHHTTNPAPRLTLTTGVRADHYCLTDRVHVSPRMSAQYIASSSMTLNAAAGIMYQNLPMFILAQDESYRTLNDPRAIHFVAGVDYSLGRYATATLEVYDKEYDNFPLEPNLPQRLIIDDGITLEGFLPYAKLHDQGQGWARGVELLIQRRAGQGTHYLIGGSLFRVKYKDLTGTWRNRNFDNQYLLTAVLGHRFSRRWLVSGRWNIAGGRPYTPFDLDAAEWYNDGIRDWQAYNGSRYETYHTLNLRVDGTFPLGATTLDAYLSVWNVYNRENPWFSYWNDSDEHPDIFYQWHILPIIGLRYAF